MSQYLKFVLERAGAPLVTKVAVLEHEKEWVNRQIVDELHTLFEGVEVSLAPKVVADSSDLIVLPYLRDFFQDQPGGPALYRELRAIRGAWVMLYGVRHRAIEVMPADELWPYFRRCRRVSFSVRVLRRLGLLNLVGRLFAKSGRA